MLNKFKRINLKVILVVLILGVLCISGIIYFSGVFTGSKQVADQDTDSKVSTVVSNSCNRA